MIRKISYRNVPAEKPPAKLNTIPSVGMSENSSESAGRTSFKMPGESYPIQDDSSPDGLIKNDVTNSDAIYTIRSLSDMADELDQNGLESEADFFDFLIKKFAEVSTMPILEEERYVEYIYKLYNSDIKDYMSKAAILTKSYSVECANSISKGMDKELSKKQAFDKIMIRNVKND